MIMVSPSLSLSLTPEQSNNSLNFYNYNVSSKEDWLYDADEKKYYIEIENDQIKGSSTFGIAFPANEETYYNINLVEEVTNDISFGKLKIYATE